MAEIVRMPKLSDTMTEGVVASWLKKVGDRVKSGEILAEIETDKATMEFESFFDGVLLHIGVPTGSTAPVDSLLAILGKEGEDISALLAAEGSGIPISLPTAAAPAPAAPVAAAPAAPVAAAPAPVPVATPAPTPVPVASAPTPVTTPTPQPPTSTSTSSSTSPSSPISPLARRLAEERGIDVMKVRGTGEGGRIVRRDIEAYREVPVATGGSSFGAAEYFEEVAVTQMRKTIARRLAESKFTAPHFYLTVSVDMDAAMEARAVINASGAVKVSVNDLVVKAAALALKKHPAVNSSWLGDRIRTNYHVHIGVAVAVEDGLLVPVVRHADTKSLSAIGGEVKALAVKAKEKKLQPAEWEGNTFTISNLGMFGIEEFTAIINPPDACILAVGSVQQVPVVKHGAVVPGQTMRMTLSCDHRVVDGATGAAFLQDLKGYLEAPVRMLA
jgi:pyruvate dehydrogenase E2 component (dihydrolipoamide acetyltransferase)